MKKQLYVYNNAYLNKLISFMTIETFTLILQIITIVWWFAFWFGILKEKLNFLKKDLEIVKGNMGSIWKNIQHLDIYVRDLSNYFSDNKIKVPKRLKEYGGFYKTSSPMNLTDMWKTLIKESGFKKILEEKEAFVFEHIKQKLDDKQGDTFFYFAEKYSIDLIKEFYEDEDKILDSFREYVFAKWLWSKKEEILTTLGLYLRDRIIKEYWKQKDFEKFFTK